MFHNLLILVLLTNVGNAQTPNLGLNVRPSDLKNQIQSQSIVKSAETFRLYLNSLSQSDEDLKGSFSVVNQKGEILSPSTDIHLGVLQSDQVWVDLNISEVGEHLLSVILESPEFSAPLNSFPKKIIVDIDTDQDGIFNYEDLDDDNDKLNDTIEISYGSNPISNDTDQDGHSDFNDAFPLDPKENKDNDQDHIGDNADPDDDNDGLSDSDEIKLKTDPNQADSDQDGLSDLEEKNKKSNPNQADSDQDGQIDGVDAFLLDPNFQTDTDLDNLPNKLDLDDQNDGVPDEFEILTNKDLRLNFKSSAPSSPHEVKINLIQFIYQNKVKILLKKSNEFARVWWEIDNQIFLSKDLNYKPANKKLWQKKEINIIAYDQSGRHYEESFLIWIIDLPRILIRSTLLLLIFFLFCWLKRNKKKPQKAEDFGGGARKN